MNEYEKFKHLLEYFVAHLEWLASNSDTKNRGYALYIEPLHSKNEFYATGQGYNGGNIQNQIKNWEDYENGNVYINIQPNYGSYKTVKCYLNWAGTGLNIIARWNGNQIDSLSLEEYQWWLKPAKRIDLKVNQSINDLGLFNNNLPNDNLKSFFDEFNSLIIMWNENENIKQMTENIEPYTKLLEEAKNIILTGAPGTGKTFLAKQIAKQIIGIQSDEELEKSDQFAFVQFHPSYDYTDFVEGLRPTKPDINGNIGFQLKNGIFKEFCKKAIGVSAISVGHIINFTLEDYEKYLQTLGLVNSTINNYKLRIEQLLGKELKAKRDIIDRVIYSSLEEICENLDDIKDFDTTNNFHNQFSASVSNLIDFKDNLSTKQEKADELKPLFVFVIDEINRGEISKIFGELFFSIDPAYRGKKGGVKTQYANLHEDENEVFYVPDNVYIIGSMNDIDRSVESFDFAMRRRFSWIEITAEQSAENMNLPQVIKYKMAKLNEQISKTDGLNTSYHIGGAYFIDTNGNPREDFETIWELRIEPLLREYIRGMPNEEDKIEVLKNAYYFNEDN
ncbi:McrB family protein [Chryseobacterium scophthalmum]|uniref:McrB family protein n=1 Tax=Chryseobacterium scophthalmum TaxID=59733 RepID=UPI001AEC067B|nr:AAA family ATPase [Chryseobacterium scophthalmum]